MLIATNELVSTRGSGTYLSAAGDVATVDVAFAQMGAGRSEPIGLLAVGAVTSGAPRVASRRARRRHLRQRRLR